MQLIAHAHNALVIVHYLRAIDKTQFEVNETRLLVMPCVEDCSANGSQQFEFANMALSNLKSEIEIFHQKIGQGRNYYFYQKDLKPKNFLGNTSSHYFLGSTRRLHPFQRNPEITSILEAMQFLCFEVIRLIANEPIEENAKH
jgi:hypothetical protein